jgi:ribosome-associated protein
VVDEDGTEKPSKSALKRHMTALQQLGKTLVELPRDALSRIPLPEDLALAIDAARKISDHEGRRRQLQYVGKIMRSVEIAPIAAALAEVRGESSAATQRLHQLEAWRDRLLNDEGTLKTFTDKYVTDAAVIGALRNTVRLAKRERAENKAPKHQRALFKELKAIIETHE